MAIHRMSPPSAAPEGQHLASVAGVCAALGLPRTYVSLQLLQRYISPCVCVAFSDGELSRRHEVETDPVLREYFGESDFAEGTFGVRLRELVDDDDPALRYAVDALIRLCGQWLARFAVRNPAALPLKQNVALDSASGTVRFDDQAVSIGRPLRVVVDYGPGMQGRFHIDTQWRELQVRPSATYTYFALSRGPLINEFLMSYWAESTQDPEIASMAIGRVYLGFEDGMASASDYLAQAHAGRTGSTEMADLVLASGVYAAGRAELRSAITNAHRLLRPGGALLIRAPESVDQPDHMTAAEMTDTAMAAGFDRSGSEFFQTLTAVPGIMGLSAVLRK